jgi:dTDP-4-dehydrorhamnose reductase
MSQKPSILLTGGSGLLAVNWFYSKRSDFTIYLGLNERQIQPHGGHILSLDFTSEQNLLKQVESISPSLVIHTAGLTNVEKCEENPELAFYINVELSSIVAKVTSKLDIPLVHISTDHLFSGRYSLVDEDEPINFINVYARTKAQAENAVVDFNPNALIIRTNFYAWGTSYRKSFSDYIIQYLRNHHTLHLFDDVYYTPMFAEKLIQTVHDLLDKKANGIFHVASDDRISKYEFGLLIAEEFGFDKLLIHKSTLQSQTKLVTRPLDISLSNRKTRELLGRNLGTVKQHIALLHEQEIEGKIQEIQLL